MRVLLVLASLVSVVSAQHRVLVGGCAYGELAVYAADGSLEWSASEEREVSDATLLPNNDIAQAYKYGARVIRPDWSAKTGFEIILDYPAPEGAEIHTCSPLPDGGYLVGESRDGLSRIIELDAHFKEKKCIELKDFGGKHSSFRKITQTGSGTYLVTQQRKGGVALEVGADGDILRRFPDGRFMATRLGNGNTLIACGDAHRLIEVNEANEIVWAIHQNDLDGITIGFVAGLQRLPNGNTVFCNWGGHGGTAGPSVIEVSPDKKVVWSCSPGKANRISAIQILD